MLEVNVERETMIIEENQDYIRFNAIIHHNGDVKNIEVIFKDRALRKIYDESGSDVPNWKVIFDNNQSEIKQTISDQLNSNYHNLCDIPCEITITM